MSFARLTPANSSLDPRAADLIHELLERWTELDEDDARSARALSCSLRFDKSLSPDDLGQLHWRSDLRDRLRTLLNPTP